MKPAPAFTLEWSMGRETVFVELGGEGAKGTLERLARSLRGRLGVRALRLLESSEQAGLLLLLVEAEAEATADLAAPPGGRLWRFRDATSAARR